MSNDNLLEIDGEAVSLMEIAGMDVGDIEEKHFELTPAGLYQFSVQEAKIEMLSFGEIDRAGIACKLKIENVIDFIMPKDKEDADKTEIAESLIGKELNHNFVLTGDDGEKTASAMGFVKGQLANMGVLTQGSWQDITAELVGHNFIAPIKHKPNKNDPDVVYVNVKFDKATPAA